MSSTTAFIRSAPTSFGLTIPTAAVDGNHTIFPDQATSTSSPASAPLFSGVGGPALILVFAACGLLIGALTAVLTLRSLRPRFASASRSAGQDDFERCADPPSLGEKPKMCDLHVSVSQVPARRGPALWRNMLVSFTSSMSIARGSWVLTSRPCCT